jgi:heparan-alpha-glucosaminide N-acetyltransferase
MSLRVKRGNLESHDFEMGSERKAIMTQDDNRGASREAQKPPSACAAELADKGTPPRLVSLDAYRGAIMLLMASSGLGLAQVAQQFPDSGLWQFLGRQTDHAPWAGMRLWDIIQPAFMFMVGVALPWSLAHRQARGQSFGRMFGHALWRATALVLLAVFLTSAWSKQTVWVFSNVLAQIGLGYPILFLLAFARPRTQWLAAFGILFAYWLAFALHPLPSAGFDWQSVGVPPDWPHLTGFAAHWEKNANFAAPIDVWLLKLLPHEKPFVFNAGGYQTLNFVPAIATMVFGLLAGQLLRSDLSITAKLKRLVLFGVVGIVVGQAIALAGLCPIVKRIWTPSWAIYSAGWVTLLLAGFVAIIEWGGWKRWAFPFVVVGLNPITLYCMWQLMNPFVRDNLKRHISQHVFESLGAAYAPTLERAAVLLVFWLILLWMHRRRIFLRI